MPVRQFTKENPCTKVDLWNCFRSKRRFTAVPIVKAQEIIGRNVPNHLVNQGFATRDDEKIRLTSEGEEWLKKGAERYIRNQIKKGYTGIMSDVENPMRGWVQEFCK